MASILLHFIILLPSHVDEKTKKVSSHLPKKLNIILKNKSRKTLTLGKMFKEDKRKLTTSMLGVSSNEILNDKSFEVLSVDNIDSKNTNIVFNQIAQYLIYPAEFVENEIKGNVMSHVFFSKEGKLILNKLKIKSASPYLRVHIARTIRAALKKLQVQGLSKMAVFKILFEFKLTTKGEDKDVILDDALYFSRWKYGISSNGDKLVHGIGKALVNMTNWLSLLEYLPESKAQKHKRVRGLRKYEIDKFF